MDNETPNGLKPVYDFDRFQTTNQNTRLFTMKTANEFIEDAKNRPIPKMLFSEFWHEGEICFLFADTNQGKSILAVQIADSISSTRSINGFTCAVASQPVLYFDFELSDKQFENRYSNDYQGHYIFDNQLQRIEINPDAEYADGVPYEDYLIQSIEGCVKQSGAKVVIVDNITYLKNDNEKAREALPLMKQLKQLQRKYELSILVLTHTPKRDPSRPLSVNDIQGSKMLINFCDSSFAIGESQKGTGQKYLKQVKARNTEVKYDTNNVALCQIVKPDNFLMFEFVGYSRESEHLRQFTDAERDTLVANAKELSASGKSQREIATQLSIGVATVNKYLKL